MANRTLLSGYPTPDKNFINERYLPAHSTTIFEDGLFASDFLPFMGRAGDRINLSEDSGAVICTPASVQRVAGQTNVITYEMTRGFIVPGMVNYRGERVGKEEELWSDRAQVRIYSLEKYASLGDWQGNMQAFDREFLKVKPHLAAEYARMRDWLFWRTLLYNDSNALSIVESSGVTAETDYFTSTTSEISTTHFEEIRRLAQIIGVRAPSVYAMNGRNIRRGKFPVLMPDVLHTDLSKDTTVAALLNNRASSNDPTMAFERLVASYLHFDFYEVTQQNGSTGHLGSPLWPMVVFSATVPADLDGSSDATYTAAAASLNGQAADTLTVAIDTSSATSYLEAALKANFLRDWPLMSGTFWMPVSVSADSGSTFPYNAMLKFSYGNGSPTIGHNEITFYGVKIEGHAGYNGADDPLTGHEDYVIKLTQGAVLCTPWAMFLTMPAHSIIYAPAPGESSRYVYEEHDYRTRRGVGIQGAMYFGPRKNWQGAIVGPIIGRCRVDYPYNINGASLFPKLLTAKSVSYYGVNPYLGSVGYDEVGPGGDGDGNFQDPTDFTEGNSGESPLS